MPTLTGGVASAMQETLDATDCVVLIKPVPSAALKAAIAQCCVVPPKALVES
jgi:hypothetical protein